MLDILRRWVANLQRSMTAVARARVRAELLARNDRFLADAGFSRELLERGIDAWPWRTDNAQAAAPPTPTRLEIAETDAELKGYSDAELSDLALARGELEWAVRNGRPGLDVDDEERSRAA